MNDGELPSPSPNILPGSIVVNRTDPVPALSSFMVQQWTVLSQVPAAMFVTLRKHYELLEGRGLVFSYICSPYLEPTSTEDSEHNRQAKNVS